jgi:ribose 5-phosphate isomerase B
MPLPKQIKTIHLATDHAGFEHKESLREWLKNSDYEVVDHGAKENDPLDDFPDFISLAAEAVSKDPEESCAFIFGGSGQGEAMMANRYPEVRASVYYGSNEEIISLTRAHNNANVLSIGARFVSVEDMKSLVQIWLSTPALTDEKYQRRNEKIETITRKIHSK